MYYGAYGQYLSKKVANGMVRRLPRMDDLHPNCGFGHLKMRLVDRKPCYRDRAGSIPCFRIAVFALYDVRNPISRLADSGSFEPATIAVEKTDTYWISAGTGPTKSTPGM